MPEIPQYVSGSQKPKELQYLINEALYILDKFGIPLNGLTQRRMERIGMAFLAIANVKMSKSWSTVKGYDGSHALRSREIIRYWNANFYENISESSYDDIRRRDLKLIVLSEAIYKVNLKMSKQVKN